MVVNQSLPGKESKYLHSSFYTKPVSNIIQGQKNKTEVESLWHDIKLRKAAD